MKRHAPGLYTEGNIALSRECDCSGYCDSRWVARTVEVWSDGYPVELGYWGVTANTKAELIDKIDAEARDRLQRLAAQAHTPRRMQSLTTL